VECTGSSSSAPQCKGCAPGLSRHHPALPRALACGADRAVVRPCSGPERVIGIRHQHSEVARPGPGAPGRGPGPRAAPVPRAPSQAPARASTRLCSVAMRARGVPLGPKDWSEQSPIGPAPTTAIG
jgi:hypothetical protein